MVKFMSYCVLRLSNKPISKTDINRVRGLKRHCLRTGAKTPDNIDKLRTHLNQHYNIDKLDDIFQDIIKTTPTIRSNTTDVMGELVFSASPDFFTSDNTQQWIDDNIKYLQETYDTDLIAYSVHLDEQTPHIHAYIMPTLYKEKTKRKPAQKVLHYSQQFCDRKDDLLKWNKEGLSSELSKLGKMQTSYANFMQNCGHDLKRGKRGSTAKHVDHKIYAKEQKLKELNKLCEEAEYDIISDDDYVNLEQHLNNILSDYDSFNKLLEFMALTYVNTKQKNKKIEELKEENIQQKQVIKEQEKVIKSMQNDVNLMDLYIQSIGKGYNYQSIMHKAVDLYNKNERIEAEKKALEQKEIESIESCTTDNEDDSFSPSI